MKCRTILLFCVTCWTAASAQGREEFNGPYPGWANVTQGFEAKGNGKDDDTRALQTAIDSLSVPPAGTGTGSRKYMVIYLPAGVYDISSTLHLKGKIAVSIVGEDPEKTTIRWTGKDSGSVLLADGSAYFKVSRLTWDANGRKGMEAIGIHWIHKWKTADSRSFAPINIEISDNRFIGGFATGIGGGTTPPAGTGANDSEVSIRRCTFSGCSRTGIEIVGFNALDYWIWDCRFLTCGTGVRCAKGNYHIYRSFFSGSVISDVHNNGGYYNSIRGCYSINANDFSSDEGASSNPFKRIFQDNTVIAPVHVPIRHNHLGKISLFGNIITASVDTTYKYSVYNRSWFPGIYETLSLHNVYGYPQPILLDVPVHKIFSIGDTMERAADPDTLTFLRSMDQTPQRVARKVFEVPSGAGALTIQSILDSAARLKGSRPVVHFGMGSYYIEKTLHIPPGADMQLVGDGWLYGSMIIQKNADDFKDQPILEVRGPSYITIRDLHFGDNTAKGQLAGIVFRQVDQPASQVHIDQLYSPGADTSLFVNDLDYLYIQKDNSFFSAGNYISGGPMVRKGKGTARVNCFGGQFARLTVLRKAMFLAKDCWWEGKDSIPLSLSGSGTVTIDGAMIAPYRADSNATIVIGRFDGSVTLMNMYCQGALSPRAANPDLSLLVWNTHFYHKMAVLDFLDHGATYRGAFLGLTAQCFRTNDPACKKIICIEDREQHVKDLDAFLETQTRQTRYAKPVLPGELPGGISNISISRISIGSMRKGLCFEK